MEVTFNYANSEPDEVDQDCMIRFICKMIAERKKDPVYMAGFEQWKKEREEQNSGRQTTDM
jgi:hypothetical protein